MFVVGDRVQVKSPGSVHHGAIGEVTGIDETRNPHILQVRLDGVIGPDASFSDAEIIAPGPSRKSLGDRIWDGIIRFYGTHDYDG